MDSQLIDWIVGRNCAQELQGHAEMLATYQVARERDYALEQRSATRVSQYIHNCMSNTPHLQLSVLGQLVYASLSYPKATLLASPKHMEEAIRLCGKEFAGELRPIGGYQFPGFFEGLYTGKQLGYPEKLGNTWHALFADDTWFYYVPVQKLAVSAQPKPQTH